MKQFIALAGFIFTFNVAAHAKEIKAINAGLSGVAIKGYDTVNYFTEKKPAKGAKEFSTNYKGAKWDFKNTTNLTLFIESPEKYTPQFGGYCAYAISQNTIAKIDPKQWT